MDVYEKMRRYRLDHQLSLKAMEIKSGVPMNVLAIIENQESVTHPHFVEKIQTAYELTDEEAELLLPICRRPSNPNYDPDHYVIVPKPYTFETLPKREVIDEYITDRFGYEIPRKDYSVSKRRAI